MVDFGAISHAASVAVTVLIFLIPIVILFFKTVDDTFKPNECFWLCLPFALSLVGVLVAQGTPLRFLFWFTGLGWGVGLPIFFILQEQRSEAVMREEDFARCHRLIAFDPSNAAAYAQLGRLYARQQQWAEAVEAFSQALQLEPENRRYRWYLRQAQAALERPPGPKESTSWELPPSAEESLPPTPEPPPTESPADRMQKAIQTLQKSEQECPRCPATPLHWVTWQEVPLQGCGRCGGFWFMKDRLARLLQAGRGTLSELQSLFGRQWSAVRQDRERLICPHCRQELRRGSLTPAPDLLLQGCPSCDGIWLEHGQLEQLEGRLQTAPEEATEGLAGP